MYLNNNYTTIGNIGNDPKYNKYANSLIQNKQASFNHAGSNSKWKVETKCKYITLSSSDRDINLYPDPNFYSITLNEPIHNVHSVKILRGNIPKGEYVVNNNNNKINIVKDGIEYDIELEIGEYDILTYL